MRSPARNAAPAAAPAAIVEPLFDNQAVSSARALPLYMQLAQHLRQLIMGGAINDRDALPAERDWPNASACRASPCARRCNR